MFYLTSKFHDDSVSIFGFMEGVGAGTPKKHRRNRVKAPNYKVFMSLLYDRKIKPYNNARTLSVGESPG